MSEEKIIYGVLSLMEALYNSMLHGTDCHLHLFNVPKYKEALQGLLDLYNKEKLNTLNLSEQLNKEKEKNKKIEDCLQMAKQIMTADISEDFDCMKLKEFKEYLLNEMKLNENFEE